MNESDTPQIIEEGMQTVNPSVMNFIMLATIAGHMARVRKYVEDKTSEGRAFHRLLTITPASTSLNFSQHPLREVAIYNTGAVFPAYFRINEAVSDRVQVLPREVKHFDYEMHKVKLIILDCNPGETTTVDITGEW